MFQQDLGQDSWALAPSVRATIPYGAPIELGLWRKECARNRFKGEVVYLI